MHNRGMAANAAAKRNSKLVIGIMLLVFAVLLILVGGSILSEADQYEEIQQNGAPDFNTLSIEQIEERPYVSGNVEFVFECFAESYTTNYGVRTSDESEELYYLVAAAPTDADGYYDFQYLICIKAEPWQFSKMDTILEETWATDFEGEYTTFEIGTSKVKSLGTKLEDILWEYADDSDLVEWLADTSFFGTNDEAEIRSRILPYMIDIGESPTSPSVGMVAFAIAAVLLIIGVLLVVKSRARRDDNPYAGTNTQAWPDGAFADHSEAQSAAGKAPTCPHCGAALQNNPDGFCPYCGGDLQR